MLNSPPRCPNQKVIDWDGILARHFYCLQRVTHTKLDATDRGRNTRLVDHDYSAIGTAQSTVYPQTHAVVDVGEFSVGQVVWGPVVEHKMQSEGSRHSRRREKGKRMSVVLYKVVGETELSMRGRT